MGVLTAVCQASCARVSLWPPPGALLAANTAPRSCVTSGCGDGLPPRAAEAPLYLASCGPSCFLHLASDGSVINVSGSVISVHGTLSCFVMFLAVMSK
jgi:hypothetical protein